MLFRVPMPYTVTGTPKGKRNETNERYWEYVEVDIAVLDDESAPVAVVWDDRMPEEYPIVNYGERDTYARLSNVPLDGIQMTRLKDGEHFLRRADRLTPEGLAANLHPKSDNRMFGQDGLNYNQSVEETPVDQASYRQDKPYSSDYDKNAEKLRKNAERYFIVGDDIFERSSEPVVFKYGYRTENERHEDLYAIVPRIVPIARLDPRTQSFRLDRYAEVVDSINEHTSRFRNGPDATMDRAPQIFIEDAVAYDDTSENFVNAVRNWIKNYSDRERLVSVNPHFGIAFLQMRLALDHFDLTGDTEAMEEWAATIVEKHPEEIRYCNIAVTYEEYANRPVSAPVAPVSRFRP